MAISDEERREVATRLRSMKPEETTFPFGKPVLMHIFRSVFPNQMFLTNWFLRLPYQLADLIDPEGPAMTSDERDTRIPYRLGTDHYCKFKNRDEYVHIGDLVVVYQGADGDGTLPYFGYLFGVKYDDTGFICDVTLRTLYESRDFCVACDGAFYYATEVVDD